MKLSEFTTLAKQGGWDVHITDTEDNIYYVDLSLQFGRTLFSVSLEGNINDEDAILEDFSYIIENFDPDVYTRNWLEDVSSVKFENLLYTGSIINIARQKLTETYISINSARLHNLQLPLFSLN